MTNLEEDLWIIRGKFHQDKLVALHGIVRKDGPLRAWDNASWVERQMLWVMWSEARYHKWCMWYTEENMRAFSKYLREEAEEIPFLTHFV